ncbi:XdhC/CoxI family protein [Ruminococcus sp.]|uniref:XdhC/CoxI family protein n=1 Tax=Ruminococcus sp. TaxID=41978 RepID=UPI002E7FF71B|nr:XdhC/CoxI family protein [Ruminococcus sp.]MEE3492088.1 XdhC/CoxI family protein [Ruminococcus sp.]
MKATVLQELLDQLNRGESPDLILSADGQTYIRKFAEADRLILLGCGHVSIDVYRLAKTIGFDVVAVDDRPMFANFERFPDAQVICDEFISAIEKLRITRRDYVCVLTRGHLWDAQCIRAILSGEMPCYLGLISSKKRAAGLREILIEEGFRKEDIDAIHAPIGLKIGAMTTAEIAVSICAELIQERHKRHVKPRENELTQTNVDFDLLRYLATSDEPRALVTVLSSTGSTPVKSGSMMAVNALGHVTGTVGGGCGEAAAINKARRIIGRDDQAVLHIDMSNEVAADNDMVCGGTMTVLIENIT